MRALAFVLLVACTQDLAADARSISFGQVTIQLAAPEEEVLGQLAQNFTVKGVLGVWAISTKHGPPFRHLGYVRFEGGRLVGASKNWSPEQESGADIARALYGAVSNVVRPGDHCKVTTHERSQPEWTTKTVLIDCGGKGVQLHLMKQAGVPEAATVSEVLGKADSD